MIGKNSGKVVVVLSKEDKEHVGRLARLEGRSTSNYVAQLIQVALSNDKFK